MRNKLKIPKWGVAGRGKYTPNARPFDPKLIRIDIEDRVEAIINSPRVMEEKRLAKQYIPSAWTEICDDPKESACIWDEYLHDWDKYEQMDWWYNGLGLLVEQD